MKLTIEQAQNIVYGYSAEFELIESNISGKTRWSIIKEGVFKHIDSGKHYSVNWREGATEMQDEEPFESSSEPIELKEVVQKDVVKKVWVSV